MKKLMMPILTLMTVLMMALSAVTSVPALAADNSVPSEQGYYYVYTANGRTLNVRESPNGTVVGRLKYGTRIYVVCFVNENWALITYRYNKPGYGTGDYACYVNRRYLVTYKPAPYTPGGDSGSGGSSGGSTVTDTLAAVNYEFKNSKAVSPYTIYSRPERVTGWVNLRYAPSDKAEVMTICRLNATLTVLRETPSWYQAQDTATGFVGYIMKKYTSR